MNSLKIILSNFKYFSVAWVFASLNFITGTWVLYIPHIKEKLTLNDAEIGTALFCFAIGILFTLPFIPYLSKKIGIGRLTITGIILFAISYIFPFLIPSYLILCINLFIAGIFVGITDVSMNALVSEIEKQDSQNFMSATHGFFSLGGAISAVVGSMLMQYMLPLFHMLGIICFIIITNLLLAKYYFNINEKKEEVKTKIYLLKNLKPLFVIALIAFIIMICEGAIEHWSALYLIEIEGVSDKKLIGLGFIVFSIAMTLGRFFGDGISKKIGSLKIILLGSSIAALGYICILYSYFAITIVGFGILGLGLSVIIPELTRIAGRTKGVKVSVGISFVSGVGFVGFLTGPVLLGYISNSFNLRVSFLFLLFLIVFAFIASFIKLRSKQ